MTRYLSLGLVLVHFQARESFNWRQSALAASLVLLGVTGKPLCMIQLTEAILSTARSLPLQQVETVGQKERQTTSRKSFSLAFQSTKFILASRLGCHLEFLNPAQISLLEITVFGSYGRVGVVQIDKLSSEFHGHSSRCSPLSVCGERPLRVWVCSFYCNQMSYKPYKTDVVGRIRGTSALLTVLPIRQHSRMCKPHICSPNESNFNRGVSSLSSKRSSI